VQDLQQYTAQGLVELDAGEALTLANKQSTLLNAVNSLKLRTFAARLTSARRSKSDRSSASCLAA
jgi:hypothetical protein